MPPLVHPLVEEGDLLIEDARALVVVRLPVLDVGLRAHNVEVTAHERRHASVRLLGEQLCHARADARQVRHLRLLLGRILLARMEVSGDDTNRGLAALGSHDSLEPTPRIHVRLSIIED